MKPLSALSYCKNNKKKLITSTISILVAVSFLYIFQTFVKSIGDSLQDLKVNPYKNHMTVQSIGKDKPIPKSIMSIIKDNSNVENIISFVSYETVYTIPGASTSAFILGIRPENIEYVMKKNNITLKEGRLPLENHKEVALDYRVSKNKNVVIGDKIGNSIEKNDALNGEYTVVGIVKGDGFLSFMPYNTDVATTNTNDAITAEKSILVFPKNNKIKEVDKLLLSFPKKGVAVMTLSGMIKLYNKGASIMRTLDMICILAIIVMVISTGSSKYVEFFSRKQELGILNAMGYTKVELMKKVFWEVFIVNLLGFTLGIIVGWLSSVLINNGAFGAVGGVSVHYSSKAFLMALYIPLFTTLFTLIPVNRMISKLDPIVMIEGI
ncbi:FtsX-like permease family protein [Clostridium sp. CM027]|uniref:ABC transporter permease n=1 Tax=Clostridium sp. CM027 TaxID=2849865 RepID=UPI001C6F5CD1|nr:FtsX-like permease family protein [Clostridium sp. CM027]MBW9145527.1 FtsX-like permease family protein [Clostridium sp. CM027]UVE42362.1 FtsX-like permease family protein [Clostridium sp. CM027]